MRPPHTLQQITVADQRQGIADAERAAKAGQATPGSALVARVLGRTASGVGVGLGAAASPGDGKVGAAGSGAARWVCVDMFFGVWACDGVWV